MLVQLVLKNRQALHFAWLGIAAVIVLGLCLWWWFRCGPATTLLILRHADRIGSEDALSAAGVARAQELVHTAEVLAARCVAHGVNNKRVQLP